jgi:asparagine synthase (glutamine-hydrolysing)
MCGIVGYIGNIHDDIAVQLRTTFYRHLHRGPDHVAWSPIDRQTAFGFQRLSIRGLSEAGNQPLWSDDRRDALACNGEVYNEAALYQRLGIAKPPGSSDCAVILPLVRELGIHRACELLDAEFAFLYHDGVTHRTYAARDPIGIRPLFYGTARHGGGLVFGSEVKFLTGVCDAIKPFPPGHFYDGERFVQYRDIAAVTTPVHDDEPTTSATIERLLVDAVRKRLVADVRVGFLLSGGLDSSLVCAIAAREQAAPIETFAVGMLEDAIDIKYAEVVAHHIGSNHHNVFVTQAQALEALDDVVFHLETWDITTIRASIGMYLICKYIKHNTDIKVLLTGEVSDELFGYKYTDYAPSPAAFQAEAQKRIRELHLYDVLRADRCIAAHSLEARVPFGDLAFASYVMAIDPARKMNTSHLGKALLRRAFAAKGYLPDSILMREKAAFSDAMGHSLVDSIKDHASKAYTEADVRHARGRFHHAAPFTKESLLYREVFEKHFPGRAELIPDYWMPNKQWENCNVSDPSARVLPNYGASGQ